MHLLANQNRFRTAKKKLLTVGLTSVFVFVWTLFEMLM